nr:unnamed protein product [uncultured bacterium]
MKKLNNYRYFDSESFLKGKTLAYLKGKSQYDEKFKGVSITVIILKDPENENEGEQFTVKVVGVQESFLNQFKMLDIVQLYDITKATVYGDFQNQLSIHAKIKKVANNSND